MSTRSRMAMLGRNLIPLVTAGLLISCASATTPSLAEDPPAVSGDPSATVVVLGEDGAPASLPRDDPAFRLVSAELQQALRRRGFRVVDEDAIAAGLGWGTGRARDKRAVLEAAKVAAASEQAVNRARLAVVFRIEGHATDLAYATRIDLHVAGELHDLASNRFLGAFELPTDTVSAPGRCLGAACFSDMVAARARDLGAELGAVLSGRLAQVAAADGREPPSGPLESAYTVTLRHLQQEDARTIVAVMTGEFPGYRRHELIRSGAAVRRYAYVTTTDAATLEHWLTLLLSDMGLTPADRVHLAFRGADIRIEGLVP